MCTGLGAKMASCKGERHENKVTNFLRQKNERSLKQTVSVWTRRNQHSQECTGLRR